MVCLRLLVGTSALSGESAAGTAPHAAARGPTATTILRQTQQALLKEFEAFLSNPRSFAATVRRECRGFPEGDLFPYVFPAFAYTNLALADPRFKPEARKRVAQLIELARPAVVRRVKPPGGRLENLTSYKRHATYLGQFNLALGCYRLIGGDGRYDKPHKAISDALHTALLEREGRPLESYPHLSWSFDTIPCLLSLQLYDQHVGKPRSRDVIARHLEWVQAHAIDKATGLPYSRINNRTGRGLAAPRGCALSLRIPLLANLDAELAKRLYQNYVRSFWIERKVVAGFAEWPSGRPGRQDADSGPIFLGIGMSATGFGVAAATAMRDVTRTERLCRQMANVKKLLQLLLAENPGGKKKLTMGGTIDPAGSYYTGFLFGDACLFYAVTWQQWSRTESRPSGT